MIRLNTFCRVMTMPAKPKWIVDTEGLGVSRPTTRQLAKIIKTLKELSIQADYGQIDRGLETIKVSSVSLEVLITLLRSTYHCRASLGAWKAFLNSARVEAKARGVNPAEAFFGLD